MAFSNLAGRLAASQRSWIKHHTKVILSYSTMSAH